MHYSRNHQEKKLGRRKKLGQRVGRRGWAPVGTQTMARKWCFPRNAKTSNDRQKGRREDGEKVVHQKKNAAKRIAGRGEKIRKRAKRDRES